jgi:hypothetical protein
MGVGDASERKISYVSCFFDRRITFEADAISRLRRCEVTAWVGRLRAGASLTHSRGFTECESPRSAYPTWLQRPTGDRVKTDARDETHLAKLRRRDDVVSVRVPTLELEDVRTWCGPTQALEAVAAPRHRVLRGSGLDPGRPTTFGYGKSASNRVHNVNGKNC